MRNHGNLLKIGLLALATYTCTFSQAQGTFSQVYSIFQTSCTFSSCHDNTGPTGGMSLIGSGGDPMGDVYSSLVEQTPNNAMAASRGYVRINPGDPHTSFLFRKINQGLDDHMTLAVGEGGSMPALAPISDVNKELIRQWILFGAPATGTVVDDSLLQDYYTNGGVESMPTRPPAPDPADGFQIHFGPYFVPPGQEQEYFLKFDPGFTDTVESNRIDMLMSNYSHHFILENYNLGEENNFQEGYRSDGAHLSTKGVTATQFSDSMFLPQNTAFQLPQNSWLDLNSHYINFDPDSILKAEVYINIYTQPNGTAKQIMHTTGSPGGITFPNILSVPNNGDTVTIESSFYDGSPLPLENDVYVWSMTSHTHQCGIDFDIYKRTSSGNRGAQIFDASYIDAIPTGTFIGYDYAQPPIRYFDPFMFTPKNEGYIFEASWVNTGPVNPVTWGLTSEDEMFIMGIFYVLDTAGLSALGVPNVEHVSNGIAVYPNPTESSIYFKFDKSVKGTITIYNSLGKMVDKIFLNAEREKLDVSRLVDGMYIYQVVSENGVQSGRFSVVR